MTAGMISVTRRSVANGLYVGKPITSEDFITIAADVQKITFASLVDVKAIFSGKNTDIFFPFGLRVRHMKVGGNVTISEGAFIGAAEVGESLVVRGDIVTWMGSVVALHGNVCATGDISSAGDVLARNGCIVSNGSIEAAGRVFSLNTWSGSDGTDCSGLAKMAAMSAMRSVAEMRETL